MANLDTYRIFPLGDSAITLDFGNIIDEAVNKKVIAIANMLNRHPLPGMIETVPAYSALTIYYNIFQIYKYAKNGETVYEWITEQVRQRLAEPIVVDEASSLLVTIPVCYDEPFGPDMQSLAESNHLSMKEIITLHTGRTYRVYMLGFLPGFSYMAEVDEKLAVPRKAVPRIKVEPGSVGIAGKQTGIYPLTSPGGWQIIGRTPVKLFNIEKDQPILLKAGDRVQFISISQDEFTRY